MSLWWYRLPSNSFISSFLSHSLPLFLVSQNDDLSISHKHTHTKHLINFTLRKMFSLSNNIDYRPFSNRQRNISCSLFIITNAWASFFLQIQTHMTMTMTTITSE